MDYKWVNSRSSTPRAYLSEFLSLLRLLEFYYFTLSAKNAV